MTRFPVILTCVLTCLVGMSAAAETKAETKAEAKESLLHIYMPRTFKATGDHLTLGDLCIIRASDEDRIKASAIPMGRSPFSKETIQIDRPTVLSRLRAHGFAKSTVQLSGAEKITVRRDEKIFTANQIQEAAGSFLKANRPGPAGCGWRLQSRITPLPVPSATAETLLKVSLDKTAPAEHVKLRVSAVNATLELAHQSVLFKLTYPTRQAVAARPLKAGEKITPENTTIRTVTTDTKPDATWTAPYGTVAGGNVKAGSVLTERLIRTPPAPVVIRRNRPVIMTVHGVGFTVTGKALALQDGRPGEYIKVRNTDSQRIVVAKVLHDGTVEPAIGR